MVQENRFGEFISNLRKEKGISLEQLSDGLCDTSLLSRFERGEREPEKLLQNRFLTRLGTVPENYENFLYYKEYCRWEKRQGIIHNILEENIETAKQLLEEYRQEYNMNYSLEQQFYLAMLAQIRRYEGCRNEDLADLFEKALQLTVPEIDTRSFRNRVLSLEELNLLLEYRYCNNRGISLQFYETLLEYIEKMEQTMLAMAKIYPKTVYYYCEAWKNSGEPKGNRAERMLELCDKAIELLRNANRMFYLWELFCMREELTPILPAKISQDEKFMSHRKNCNDWRETLEEVYREYGISIAMYEFCYLYVESENYCIGDVIRIRRKMLGLSQEKLSQGICDSRTVSRLERHICKPQKEIVQQLFDRLNLSTELCRTELVTDSQEAIEKFSELKFENINHNYRRIEEIIAQLEQLIDMRIPFNKQIILNRKIINEFNLFEISTEDFLRKMKEALGYTVPYYDVIKPGERYLTNEEIVCIQNITLKIDDSFKEMRECMEILESLFHSSPKVQYNLRVYEFTMLQVSSYLGNHGEFIRSDVMKNDILLSAMRNRRIRSIHFSLYGLLWNREQQDKIVKKEKEKILEQCIKVSILCKDGYRTKEYEKKKRIHSSDFN